MMATDLSSKFPSVIAERLRSASAHLARLWLAQLRELLPLDVGEVFPSDQILDHIPLLIVEIADYVASEADEAIGANTVIQSKARELGELRFDQRASVHQLLREYRLLSVVLTAFVRDQFEDLSGGGRMVDAVLVLERVHEATFALMQITVDTFVGRYMDRIEEQTMRLDGFNRMLTHEVRQPLSAILTAVELLRSDAGREEEVRARFLAVAQRNVTRVADLVRVLGTLARPGEEGLQTQVVDLHKVAGEAVRQVTELATSHDVELRNAVDSMECVTDPSRLELILVNLLSNAVKYRDAGRSPCYVEVSLRREPDTLCLVVRDNGLGIPEKDRARIFKRHVRAHADLDRALGVDGLGLGLAIAAECARGLKGSIALESGGEDGETRFVVRIPFKSAAS
jgi:signal transduction histidine kinase